MIKKDWLRYHQITEFKPSYRRRIIQSWDTAGKAGPRNSFSVCTTWLLENDVYFLIDLVRGRFDYPTLETTAVNLAERFKPNRILVEDASTGMVLGPALRKATRCVVELVPVALDKVSRLYLQQGKFASGRVQVPANAPFLSDLLKELLSFPQSKTTDQVDSISQALAHKGSSYTLDYIS